MAGRVLWQTTVSLDGFIAGPDDAMDWVLPFFGPNPAVDEIIPTIGAVLSGKRSDDVGRTTGQQEEFQEVYGGAWRGPQFVLTHHPPNDGKNPAITFLSNAIPIAVDTALRAANGKGVLTIGANVARQCIEADLVSEIYLVIAPILLGDGVRLFSRKDARQIGLQLVGVSQAGQLTNLHFRFPPK
jgi:dihydrofolate reductase